MAGTVDYNRFIGRLPYASEMFGTYRPMIGWASKRKRDRIIDATADALPASVATLIDAYASGNTYTYTTYADRTPALNVAHIGAPTNGPALQLASFSDGSFLLPALHDLLQRKLGPSNPPQSADEWRDAIGGDALNETYGVGGLDRDPNTGDPRNSALTGIVSTWDQWRRTYFDAQMAGLTQRPGESPDDYNIRRKEFEKSLDAIAMKVLDRESQLGGLINTLIENQATDVLLQIFYSANQPTSADLAAQIAALQRRIENPFLEFDPTNGLTGASVSPIGVVHLFREYFFEFDSFLGPPVGHVWLTPGSVVELIESSTRTTTVERSMESSYESVTTTEAEDKTSEDVSDVVKQDNRDDTKLGFSTTVNQSWGTGSMSATASINMDKTQQEAREHTQKRMREQSQKVSTELRKSYKTTFRTVTQSTDVSSKRYVLENKSETELQNYEMRRKMRQVGIQVQDIGSYLCWETYVDDPGRDLGLGNLVHVAKPPDTTPLPDPTLIPLPERKPGVPFTTTVAWGYPDDRQFNSTPQGVPLGRRQISVDIPDGYRLDLEVGKVFELTCTDASGDGADGFRPGQYLAVYQGDRNIDIGRMVGPGGLKWDKFVTIDLSGSVALVPSDDRVAVITAQNQAILAKAADTAQTAVRDASEAAYYAAVKDRIEMAAAITARNFEDLREEERTVVYRALIADLMAKDSKTRISNYTSVSDKQRHIFATVINAIFDIDKMLYFVAPEWWRPRAHASLTLGSNPVDGNTQVSADKVVSWSDHVPRDANYYLTGASQPAKLGSSLGWLLQLDGDDNRNRFLNAPWVRSVIPIRPGMEAAATNWLESADVEGAEGLDAQYAAVGGEAQEILDGLHAAGLQCSDPPTIRDAISYLCVRLDEKNTESVTESLFPNRDGIADDDKVWSTPVDKVYEHGFYPLERSFRADPVEPPTDSKSPNFQIMAQWTEILPTDQIVPVAVKYDPITGRMLDAQ